MRRAASPESPDEGRRSQTSQGVNQLAAVPGHHVSQRCLSQPRGSTQENHFVLGAGIGRSWLSKVLARPPLTKHVGVLQLLQGPAGESQVNSSPLLRQS